MKRYLIISGVLFSLLFTLKPLQAQNPVDTLIDKKQEVKIVLVNDIERIGVIISDDGREILLRTKSIGDIYIPKNDIVNIIIINREDTEEYDGDLREAGVFSTRYIFTTNSLPIKKHEDYAFIHLYGPELHFSLSDRFSLGLMTTWIASPFVLAMKYSIPAKNKKVNYGFGTLLGTSGYLNNFSGYGGLHWGMISFGDRIRNITFLGGISYVNIGNVASRESKKGNYPWVDNGNGNYSPPYIPSEDYNLNTTSVSPVFGIGGKTKIGRKASFIFDSMIAYTNYKQKEIVNEEFSDAANPYTVVREEVYYQDITTIVIMPSVRWQRKTNRSVQVSLAGVTQIRNPGFISGSFQQSGRDIFTFPVPMVSWLIQF